MLSITMIYFGENPYIYFIILYFITIGYEVFIKPDIFPVSEFKKDKTSSLFLFSCFILS